MNENLDLVEILKGCPKLKKKYNMERKIGEVFECDGKKFQVIEDPIEECDGCYFVKGGCTRSLDIRGYCGKINRKDRCAVIFKEIKDINKENKQSILDEAKSIVEGSRQSDYGDPVESFERISKAASMIAGKDLSPNECCAVLMAAKIVRESYSHKRDNLVDLCGYAEIMNRINESKKKGE
ncbi:DUF6378 domain-containing protein [Intestinibacter sp.]|uniref:DUF6378 domain-containing protein n=1 Tax=Intestinibacter sp. TaxID=1965304 RepID=UPI003F16B79E